MAAAQLLWNLVSGWSKEFRAACVFQVGRLLTGQLLPFKTYTILSFLFLCTLKHFWMFTVCLASADACACSYLWQPKSHKRNTKRKRTLISGVYQIIKLSYNVLFHVTPKAFYILVTPNRFYSQNITLFLLPSDLLGRSFSSWRTIHPFKPCSKAHKYSHFTLCHVPGIVLNSSLVLTQWFSAPNPTTSVISECLLES